MRDVDLYGQGLEEFRWPVVVGVGKGGAGHGLRTQVIELSSVHGHIADAVSHGMAGRQMDEREADKLIPSTENTCFPLSRMLKHVSESRIAAGRGLCYYTPRPKSPLL